MLGKLSQGGIDKEAQVIRARSRLGSFWLEFLAEFVQVDLLRTKAEGLPAATEGNNVHAEDRLVKPARRLNVTDSQPNGPGT